jgi:hypothetical protein
LSPHEKQADIPHDIVDHRLITIANFGCCTVPSTSSLLTSFIPAHTHSFITTIKP